MNNNKRFYVIFVITLSCFIAGGLLFGEKKKGFSGFEFSIGGMFPEINNLAYKNDFVKGHVNDLLAFYNSVGINKSWDFMSENYHKITYLLPVNISAIYQLNKILSLKAGVEFAFGDCGSLAFYKITDTNNDISIDNYIKQKTSYFMPYIGVEYQIIKPFALYASLGLGLSRFSGTENFNLSNLTGIYYKNRKKYSGNATGTALVFGGKFNVNKVFFIKIEYMFYKTGALSGNLDWTDSNWKASDSSGLVNGDFYTYDTYFTNSGHWIKDWTVFSSASSSNENIKNMETMKFDFSTIRVMFGFYF